MSMKGSMLQTKAVSSVPQWQAVSIWKLKVGYWPFWWIHSFLKLFFRSSVSIKIQRAVIKQVFLTFIVIHLKRQNNRSDFQEKFLEKIVCLAHDLNPWPFWLHVADLSAMSLRLLSFSGVYGNPQINSYWPLGDHNVDVVASRHLQPKPGVTQKVSKRVTVQWLLSQLPLPGPQVNNTFFISNGQCV